LQQIEYLTGDLLQFFEYDDGVVRECDQAVMRLHEAMAADPAPIPVDQLCEADRQEGGVTYSAPTFETVRNFKEDIRHGFKAEHFG
jgi:hypothetical protein